MKAWAGIRRAAAASGDWIVEAPTNASAERRAFVFTLAVSTMLAVLVWPIVPLLGVPAWTYLVPLYCAALSSHGVGALMRWLLR